MLLRLFSSKNFGPHGHGEYEKRDLFGIHQNFIVSGFLYTSEKDESSHIFACTVWFIILTFQ